MNELHLDLYPIIFSYLTQNELIDMLFVFNRMIYDQTMKYITKTRFTRLRNSTDAREKAEKNMVISVIRCQDDKYNAEILAGSCLNGNIRLLNNVIRKGERCFDYGLYYACKGANYMAIDLMILYGAKAWGRAFRGACIGGDLNIVKKIIELYDARDYDQYDRIDYARGLEKACKNGHIDVVKYLLPIFLENHKKIDLEYSMNCACRGGNLDIVKLLLTYLTDIIASSAIYSACKGGNREIVDLVLSIVRDNGYDYSYNNRDQVINMPSNFSNTNIKDGIEGALRGGHVLIAEYMMERFPTVKITADELLEMSCLGGHIECVEFAGAKGATDWNKGLTAACQKAQNHLYPFLAEKGATRCDNCYDYDEKDLQSIEKHLRWYRKIYLTDEPY